MYSASVSVSRRDRSWTVERESSPGMKSQRRQQRPGHTDLSTGRQMPKPEMVCEKHLCTQTNEVQPPRMLQKTNTKVRRSKYIIHIIHPIGNIRQCTQRYIVHVTPTNAPGPKVRGTPRVPHLQCYLHCLMYGNGDGLWDTMYSLLTFLQHQDSIHLVRSWAFCPPPMYEFCTFCAYKVLFN